MKIYNNEATPPIKSNKKLAKLTPYVLFVS